MAESSPKMSEYRRKQMSSRTPPVVYRGAAPTTPHKLSALKQSSVFPNFSTHLGFESKMDDLFSGANVSHTGGSVEEAFERYVSGLPSPHETDILHFWEVSLLYTAQVNAANYDDTDQ